MSNCGDQCPCSGKKSWVFGNKDSKILIITEPPTIANIETNTLYSPKAKKLLDRLIREYKLGSVMLMPCIRCPIQYVDENNNIQPFSKKMENQALKECKKYIKKVIEKLQPELIITLGTLPVKSVLNKSSVLKVRGVPEYSEEYNCYVFPTVSPNYCLVGSSHNYITKEVYKMSPKERLIFDDFSAIKKFRETGNTDIDTSNYREATLDDLKEIAQAKRVAIDFETNGTKIFDKSFKVLSVSFTIKEGESRVVIFDENLDDDKMKAIKEIFENDAYKIVANRLFENSIVNEYFGWKLNGKVFDVLSMAHLLNENSVYSYNLENVANMHTDLKNIKDIAEGQRTTLEGASKDLIIRYNGVDTDATFRAYQRITSILNKNDTLKRYYLKFLQPIEGMYAYLYPKGFGIDIEEVKKSENELKQIADEIHEKVIEKIPMIIKSMHKEKGLKLSRAELIKDYLFNSPFGLKRKPVRVTLKTKEPKTDEAHLKTFSNIPVVQDILRWKKADKLLNTYYKQIYDALHDTKNGYRIYPNTLFINTVTGRTVVKNPTIQTIPQRGEFAGYIKRIFKAPDGWMLCARDLSQSELRIIGWLAKDKNILTALDMGVDLHTKTASIVNNIPVDKVTKELRNKAKSVNFGFVYGMQAKSFVTYAKDEYGLDFTEAEAVKVREKFFSKPNGYYMLPEYHKRMINFARKHGYVESPLGRRRNLPAINNNDDFFAKIEAERQAINHPVQSFSSDLALISKMMFCKEIKTKGLEDVIQPLWFIHDAILFLAREDYIMEGMKLLAHSMSTLSVEYISKKFGVEVTYPVESDGKFGKTWEDMQECE